MRLVGTKLVKAMKAKVEKDRRVPLTSWEVVIIRRPENAVKLLVTKIHIAILQPEWQKARCLHATFVICSTDFTLLRKVKEFLKEMLSRYRTIIEQL